MTDATSTTTTATPETPLPNTPEARTPTGEIKNASDLAPAPTPEPAPTPDTPKPEIPQVPETYAFKLPEGTTLNEDLLKEISPIFKDLGLTQDAAQKLVDWNIKAASSEAQKAKDAVAQMRAEWKSQVEKDPELGPRLDEVKANIGRALNTLDPALKSAFQEAMNFSGFGNNPALIKVMSKFAEAVNEGKHVSGAGPSPHGQIPNGKIVQPSAAQALYPNLASSRS